MEKMRSGEIAKKAGISQKTVRLYDEKGLLKPTEYSEGNYRLYDKEALLVLENIIALKQIGFSLEEIRDNLITAKNLDIAQSLNRQLEIMEQKKAEIERTIGCIRGVLARTGGQPDWNAVAEIARMIQYDQSLDDRHFHALQHNADNVDWYVKIYESLGLQAGAKVLDLGCGYGKLWRNNWTDIPQDVVVDGIDLHGSWADDFAGFIEAKKGELAEGADISIQWADLDEEAAWEALPEDAYTCVVAHYLLSFLKDEELLIQRAAGVLADGGMFSCNGYGVTCRHLYFKQMFEDLGLQTGFITERMEEAEKNREAFKALLGKYFKRVESVKLTNNMKYDSADELFEKLCEFYPEAKKYLVEKEGRIKARLEKLIVEQGEVVIRSESQFWHCYK